jgi:hypothetical protein
MWTGPNIHDHLCTIKKSFPNRQRKHSETLFLIRSLFFRSCNPVIEYSGKHINKKLPKSHWKEPIRFCFSTFHTTVKLQDMEACVHSFQLKKSPLGFDLKLRSYLEIFPSSSNLTKLTAVQSDQLRPLSS